MRKPSPSLILAAVLFVLFLTMTTLVYHDYMDISTARQPIAASGQAAAPASAPDTVHIGVISRFSPNLIYEGYQPIMEYLSRSCGRPFSLKLGSHYEETIAQLDQGTIQAAFLGTYLYLKARQHHPIRCILKPLNSQFEPYFHSVLIARTDSPINSIASLKGKRLALPSPLSFSGNWLLGYELERHGLTVSDLDSVHYFGFHHTVIYQVLLGHFDAGAVKDRVAEEFADKGIRIIATSGPVPGSPIIVRKDLDPALIEAITTALLRINVREPAWKDLVRDWDAEFAFGFAPASDRDYDAVATIFRLEEQP